MCLDGEVVDLIHLPRIQRRTSSGELLELRRRRGGCARRPEVTGRRRAGKAAEEVDAGELGARRRGLTGRAAELRDSGGGDAEWRRRRTAAERARQPRAKAADGVRAGCP